MLRYSFSIEVYGDLEKYNDTISKARCRIFYTGLNRNGTYITDEFAKELLTSVPYTPVKGIFLEEGEKDFSGHGDSNDEGKIYGIVPENPNAAFESHLDEDGQTRLYACVDILLYTAIYKEAKQIVGKSQSMELYRPSVEGNFELIEGQRAFKFTKGKFLGLQILGNDVEPCFEGAQFFALYEDFSNLFKKLEEFNKKKTGGCNMELRKQIMELLNPQADQEIKFDVLKVADYYAIFYNYDEKSTFKVNFSIEEEKVILGEKEQVVIFELSQNEAASLESLKGTRGNLEGIEVDFSSLSEKDGKILEFEQKVKELTDLNSTLVTEKETFSLSVQEKENLISGLNQKVTELESYKSTIEDNAKKNEINKYSKKIPKEKLDEFYNKIDSYSLIDLKKDLAFSLVETNPSFLEDGESQVRIPKPNSKLGLEEILDKYI